MDESMYGEATPESAPPEFVLPSLPVRLLNSVFSPGKMAEGLAVKPVWAGALLLVMILVGVQTWLIPLDVLMAAQREALLERGADPAQMAQAMPAFMRYLLPIFFAIAAGIFTFFFAGLYTLIFAFIMGDEGKYRQYLAMTTHAWFLPTIVGLALVPLKISTGNPQFTLNLGSFFFFLPDGYFLNFLTALDLTQIWATVVIAVGANAIDRNRSIGSAFMILLGILIAFALIMANFL